MDYFFAAPSTRRALTGIRSFTGSRALTDNRALSGSRALACGRVPASLAILRKHALASRGNPCARAHSGGAAGLAAMTRRYCDRFPGDVDRVAVVADRLDSSPDCRPSAFDRQDDVPVDVRRDCFAAALSAAAETLAAWEDYPVLYDVAALAANEVPVDTIVYFDDMYVDAQLSLDTVAVVGNMQSWVTNEFEHDGLRASAELLERLLCLRERADARS
ncbi:MAG TPA: hypothetical protein VGD34_20840 [Kribbella sp.]